MMSESTGMNYGIGRIFAAFFISVAVNTCIFIMLATLNPADSPQDKLPQKHPPPIRLLKMNESRVPTVSLLKQAPPEPEIMTVDIEQAIPQTIEPKPVNFTLSIPKVSEYAMPVIAVPSKTAGIVNGRENCQPAGLPCSVGRVDEPPEELDNLPPRYPRNALVRGIQGSVLMKLLINERGMVENIRILRVEGDEAFRSAVLEVARKWRFKPARHNGRLVKVWGIKRIRFELEK